MLHSYPFCAVHTKVVHCVTWGKTASSVFAITKKIRDWKNNCRLVIKNGFGTCWGAWRKRQVLGRRSNCVLCWILSVVFCGKVFRKLQRDVWDVPLFSPCLWYRSHLSWPFSFLFVSAMLFVSFNIKFSCVLVPTQLTFFKFLNAGCSKFVAFKILDVNSSW